MSLTENIIKQFETLEAGLNGEKQSFLFNLRKDAFTSFQKLGIPSNRHEEWRYTNIKTQLPETLSVAAGKESSISKDKFHSFDSIKASRLVFVNGVFNKELSQVIEQRGVTISTLAAQLKNKNAVVEKHYGKLVKQYEEHFSVLNTAFVTDGSFIHISKGVAAENPVFILHLYNSPENFVQSRDLVVVEEGAIVNVVFDFQNIGTKSFYNHVAEFFVADNANATVTYLQTETGGATAVHTLESEVGRSAVFNCTTVTYDGKLIRNSINARLVGENCEVHLNGLYYGTDDSLIDNHILVDHIVPNCQSNQRYKGILDDESAGVFNGKIFVKQDAQKTNAFQSSKAILLSDNASVDSKPQLEIFADDVKCSHGAAIGQLSDNEVFYLRARGIEEVDARAILTYAFANDILENISNPDLKNYLDSKLKSRLNLQF